MQYFFLNLSIVEKEISHFKILRNPDLQEFWQNVFYIQRKHLERSVMTLAHVIHAAFLTPLRLSHLEHKKMPRFF